ncbi:ABC transporter permease [Pseudonocardia sp. P1]|nr:putative ABC transporter integral membrane protein [Pseudonocardia sp. Ae707_Ps1]
MAAPPVRGGGVVTAIGNPATRAAVAGIRRSPRQALLTGLAVLVATVFAAASVLFTGTMRDALLGDAVQTPPAAAFVVDRPAEPDKGAAAFVDRIAGVPGVTGVVPVYEGALPVTTGATTARWRVGTDPGPGPMSVRPAPVRGHVPGPGEVLLGTATADRAGLVPGAPITVGDRAFTVGGIAPLGTEATDTVLLTPVDATALGADLGLSRIDVAGTPDRAALDAAAGDAAVLTGDEARAAESDAASASVTAVLAGLSVFVGIALVAAVIVVGSTFRIVLGRRTRELALLRCVGAGRGQLVRSVLAEAAVTGLVAGLAGTALAAGGASATLAVLRASGTEVPGLVLPWSQLAGCVLLAVAATVAAAVPPALTAGRVPPVVALGAADSTEAHAPRAARRLPAVAVLVVLAAGVAVLGLSTGDSLGALALVALSGLMLFAALVAAGPFLVAGAAAAVRPLAGRSGPARLAVANARRVSRRTAATTTVLALGVGLTAALLVGIDGASADARASIERNFPAEVQVVPGDDGRDPVAARQLAERPELQVRTDGTDVLVDGAPGAAPEAVRTAVAEATGGTGATVIWAADVRAETEEVFGTVRAVGAGLVGVTLVVAVVGVGVTLALSVAERTREIALQRTLGLTRSGARRTVAAEAALAGAVGAVLGVALGALYGALGLQAMDMDMPVSAVPAGELAGLGAGVVAVAVLASAASMRRAGRVAPAHGVAAG